MSVRKENVKQSKQKDRDFIKSLMQNVRNHWPDQIISEEHLQNPTAEFVKSFYSRFYSEYESVTNNIRTNIMGKEEKIDQNIYNDEISFTIKLKKICKSLGIPFNLNDICEPQPKRTLTYFSVLMNVLIFLKSNTQYINEIEECVEKKKRLEELKESKSTLLQEIGDLNELHVRLGNSVMDLNQDIQNLTKEHENIMMLKAEKDFKYLQDIKIINKLKEDIKGCDDHLNKLREESSLLLEQIVCENEVEKLKAEIDDLKIQFNTLDIDRANVVASLKVQEEKTLFHNKCLELVENPLFSSEKLDSLKVLIEKLASLNHQVSKFEETINLKRAELINLKEEYLNLNNSVQTLQKQFEESNSEYGRESIKMKEDLNKLVLKIKKDEETFKEYERTNKNFEDIIISLKNDLATVKSHFSVNYKQLIEHQDKVLNRFREALLNIKESQLKDSKSIQISQNPQA